MEVGRMVGTLDGLEPMKTLSLSSSFLRDPTHRRRRAWMPIKRAVLSLAHAAPHDSKMG